MKNNNKPRAYIEGRQLFFGRYFRVDERVYVPNHETEFLVRSALEAIKENDTVVDVGTGCGNIAITIKLERPTSKVTGCDISRNALEVAHENAVVLGADVDFYWSNYVNNKSIREPRIVVADLPWGTPKTVLHKGGLDELMHMPEIALFHPDGPLANQDYLIKSICQRGWKPQVFLETGLVTKNQVAQIIPQGVHWEYRQSGDYSITVLKFGGQND